ncbi:MAG: 1-acyl-sn-glycerol-3-phosphate acyltransferase [Spirochaetaceae bacterium]|jgi:1-acyl-sn-glycerol-3-phosphate acyltransferase|nr:1-acyl-sn-glycerol-3-phosphate acyltransferase [Spirochaetaceae bacterium]
MVVLKTIAVFALTGFVMIVFIPLGAAVYLISLCGLKKQTALLIYKIAQIWAHLIIKCTGCPITIKGAEHIPRTEPVCFISNHDSIFDSVLLLAYAGRPVGFIAKKELMLIPFIDLWILLLGGLFIDRTNSRKALKTIARGVKRITEGSAMIIFPEGTRSRGRGLLPFRPGSLRLATQSQALIVPVAISGSYEVFEKTGFVQARPVSVQFGSVIATASLPPTERRQVLADQLQGIIAALLRTAAENPLSPRSASQGIEA